MPHEARCSFCWNEANCVLRCRTEQASLSVKQLDFNKEGIVYSVGMPAAAVFGVKTGSVRLTLGDQRGGSRIVRFAKGGDFLGFDALLPRAVYTFTATAREASTICFVTRQVFELLLTDNSQVGRTIVLALTRLLQDSETEKTEISGLRVPDRLAKVILRFPARTARRTSGDAVMDRTPPMAEVRQWEIAQFLGVSEETVSRELRKFRIGRSASGPAQAHFG